MQELNRQKRLLTEENDKYVKERDKLNQKDGELKAFLEYIKKKRQHYAEIGIENIIERIEKEGELKIHQDSLKHQEATFTGKNQSVKVKYDALKQELDDQLKTFRLEIQQKVNVMESDMTQSVGQWQRELTRQHDEITDRYTKH